MYKYDHVINKSKEIILYVLNVLKRKVDGASIYILQTSGLEVQSRNFNLENLFFNRNSTITITAYKDYKKCVVSSNNLSISNIKKILSHVFNMIQYTSRDRHFALPHLHLLSFQKSDISLFYPYELNVKKSMDYAKEIEMHAVEYDKQSIYIENIYINSYMHFHIIGNTDGLLQNYHSTLYSMSSVAIAKCDSVMQQDYSYTIARSFDDLNSTTWLGTTSAKRAKNRLFAKKIKTQKCPVIIFSDIANIFFSYFVSSIRGHNVYQKSTVLLNYMNKKIFPHWFNILENPNLNKGLSSKPFDSEGVKSNTRFIVQDGILCSWLLNNYTARKLGMCSTGHADSIHNWFIFSQLNVTFSDLLKKVYRGLLVTEFMGQGVNIVTGNYSQGIFGFWIEKGVIQYPVTEVTISGNLLDMWKNIVGISNDIDTRHSIQCGSVLLQNMQISGL
ncbi:metalloprotease PmbA [Buchnera aphidicola]|uniref:metalloprotease PmbA n=1 Tax=Buchnera aphidicola TaxID=9 RepID=UPI0031B81F22